MNNINEILSRLDFNEWEVALYKVPITWCEMYDIRDYVKKLEKENDILTNDIKVLLRENESKEEVIIRLSSLLKESEDK